MVKKASLLALCLIVIGIVGSIVTFSSGNKSSVVNETKKIQVAEIHDLTIKAETTDIEIMENKDGDEVIIELVGKTNKIEQLDFSVNVKDSTLFIDVAEDKPIQLFNINFKSPDLTLNVYLPTKTFNRIDINGVSSDVYIENMNASTLKLETVSGDIEGEASKSDQTNIKTVSGDLEIQEIIGELTIQTTSGDIDLSNFELLEPIDIKTVSGDIHISTLNEPNNVLYNVKSVSGDINLFDQFSSNAKIGTGALSIKLETVSGDIAIESNE